MNKYTLLLILLLLSAAIILSGCVDSVPAKEEYTDDVWKFVKDLPIKEGIFKFEDGNNTCYYSVSRAKDSMGHNMGSLSCVSHN